MNNVNSQSLGLDLVNINVYAKVYQNIPLSSRGRTIFTFSEFGTRPSKASTNDKCHFTISWTRCRQYQCIAYAKFYQNISNGKRVMDIFHEQAGDKIFTNCPVIIGHFMKVNLQFQLTFLGSCNVPLGGYRNGTQGSVEDISLG